MTWLSVSELAKKYNLGEDFKSDLRIAITYHSIYDISLGVCIVFTMFALRLIS